MKKTLFRINAILTSAIVTLLYGVGVMAWGPERPLYTMEEPATSATFNSIWKNSAIGDERNFVRVVEAGSKEEYSDIVKAQGGKQYRVMIYYHNNASTTFNTKEQGYKGVARDVRVATTFPTSIEKGKRGTVIGVITSSNAEPKKIWDEAYFEATEDVTLKYVAGSAKIYNQWGANGTVLPDALFSSTGTLIGQDKLNGMIMGCAQYSGQVVYTVAAESVEPEVIPEPEPEPQPEPEPDPEKPTEDPAPEVTPVKPQEELPSTGPLEIVLGCVVGIVILAGALYFWYSSKELKKTKNKALGKK